MSILELTHLSALEATPPNLSDSFAMYNKKVLFAILSFGTLPLSKTVVIVC